MDKFEQIRVFVAVIDASSFVRAGSALGLSKQSVSRHVSDLEARLGVRLLNRTTRNVAPTPEGRDYGERCRALLADMADADAEIALRAGEPTGLLKLAVPQTFGVMHLAPLWPKFMAMHPKVTLDVNLGDRVVDIVDEGVDLAVRIARLPSSSLVSRKLASTRVILCASPAYLRARGSPERPADIARHDTIAYSLLSTGEHWEFTGPDGPVSAKVSPRMWTNSGETCREAALQGQGLIVQPSFLVGEDLAAGRLVEVMPGYRSIELGVYAVYPSRKHLAPKIRSLIDFLADELRSPAWMSR